MQSFESPGAEGLSCAQCHPALADSGPGDQNHGAHAEPAGGDCNSCHLGAFNDPPIEQNCTRCHGRFEDAGGDNISAGEGRGLRQHHQNAGVSDCGLCHSDATGPAGVGEDVPPAFYPGVGAVLLDPCDGTEEGFPSNTVSLDNDGNLLTDGADPACAPPECTVDADCDDTLFCNGAEICFTGICLPGTPPDCNDGVACTDDSCDAGSDACVNTPNDANCDDQELCTTDSCDSVSGCANVPVVCPPGQQCDSADGICKTPPECTVDADCDNGFFCDGAEICFTGTCLPGTPPDCDDGVGCTVDTCDELNDACVNTPDDASCDDNNVCTGSETCDPVNDCQPGTPLDCDDGQLCTTDSCAPLTGCDNAAVECPAGEQCDPADGICKAPPGCTVDADCDDTLFCNGAETCDTATGTCQPGTPPDCDDGVGCTVDTCDETSDTCVNTPNDANCDDGDVCNGSETCDATLDCQAGTPLDCDDQELCTTDSCDSVSGCANVPVECPAGEICDSTDGLCKPEPDCTVDADCDDGFFCNGVETCDVATGTCQAGTPPDCDDGVDCTVDTCDEVNDACANTPDDLSCPDDGLFCTGDEICDPAAGCVSTGDPCPEGTTCNEDSDTCDMVSGKVTICHKNKRTLSVNVVAVPAHLRHGDTLGPCP
jgi:hypothetical protein